MDLGLTGRTALVLGAGGGLGSAIAAALAAEGAQIAVADVRADAAEATAEAITASGGRACPFAWDLADIAAGASAVADMQAAHSHIDILVNNTGGPPPTTASGQPLSMWQEHFAAMVLPVIALTDLVLPGMRERRWGRVVTSASSGVIAPIPNLGLSNALRSSLVGWSKTLAREVGPDGVTVNMIIPGRIATGRIVALDEARAAREGTTVEHVAADSASAIALHRYGEPAEYGRVAAFLASEAASYITGSVVRVDGGLIPSV